MRIKEAIIKAMIVLFPSYTVAFLTEKMVYVVPMLAASSFFAAAIDFSSKEKIKDYRRQVDEDESDDGEGEIHETFDPTTDTTAIS